MFDWFKKKDSTQNNILEFPVKPVEVPPMPDYIQYKQQPNIQYVVGITDDKRVSLTLGSGLGTTLYMNAPAVKGMIAMLESAVERLEEQ